MGANNPNLQLPSYLPPQQQAAAQQQLKGIQALRAASVVPYAGTAPGGGTAQSIAQIAQALIARQRLQDWQKKWGVQSPTANAMTPVGSLAPTMTPSTPTVGAEDA